MIGILNMYIPVKLLPPEMTTKQNSIGEVLCSCSIEDPQKQYNHQFLSNEFEVHSIQPIDSETEITIEGFEVSEKLVQYIKDDINEKIVDSIISSTSFTD